jgi:hypothetical protein
METRGAIEEWSSQVRERHKDALTQIKGMAFGSEALGSPSHSYLVSSYFRCIPINPSLSTFRSNNCPSLA